MRHRKRRAKREIVTIPNPRNPLKPDRNAVWTKATKSNRVGKSKQ